jgi:hypothetical protein
MPAIHWWILAALTVAAPPLSAQSREIQLLDYHAGVPGTWTSRAPSSSSRLAEFVVPATVAGTAEVVVFFFGPQQRPNVDANLTRWRGQFSNPDNSPVAQLVSRDSSGAFPLTFAEYRGTYRRGIGAGSADSVKTGQALIASIVETPKGVMFIQLFGTAARVEAERETFVRFVKGIK